MATICLDISTAALDDAADFITAGTPPGNYKKAESIAEWLAADKAERLERAGLDPDLCRITGVVVTDMEPFRVLLCRTEDDERRAIHEVAGLARIGSEFVTYNGRAFDVPVLKRRARYLGVAFPDISTDKYRSPVIDLMTMLSDNDIRRTKSLQFYVQRLKMSLTKPLSGAEEAQVYESGKWNELTAALEHDVTAIKRLAEWAGVIK